MKNYRLGLLVSAAILAAAGTDAHAGTVAPASQNWTGLYVGAGGGGSYSFADIDAAGYGFFSAYEYCDSSSFVDDATNTQFGSGSFCMGDGYAATSAAMGKGTAFSDISPSINWDDQINTLINGLVGSERNDAGAPSALGLVKLGADRQISSNVVLGLTADFRFGSSTIKQSAAANVDTYDSYYSDTGSSADGELTATVEIGNSWSIGSRAGFLPADNILLYVSGGYTSTKASLKTAFTSDIDYELGSDTGDLSFDLESKQSEWLHGYYLGAGVDMMLTDKIMAGVEYRYADLGELSTYKQYQDCCNWAAGAGVGGDASLTSHSITATIAYRFGLK